jgi:hypothetical protein
MQRLLAWVLAIAALSLFFAPSAATQPQMGSSPMRGSPQRLYDRDTVETITGEVTAIERVGTRGRGMGGVHLQVMTEAGSMSVHLGPAWYLGQQELQLQAGDEVEVTGSRVVWDDEPMMIAAEIRRGDQVLTLRDRDGFPVWMRTGCCP